MAGWATAGYSGHSGHETDGRVREFDAVDFESDVVYVVTLGHPALYLHDRHTLWAASAIRYERGASQCVSSRKGGVLGVLVRLPGCRAYRLANLDQGVLPDPLILLQQRSVHGTRRITS